MMQLKLTLLLCAIGLVSLTGCGQPSAPTASAPSGAEPSSVATAPNDVTTAPTATEYPELLNVVSKTQAAVAANDFGKAQQEFDQFESVWSQVEDGIKDQSAESYDAIEEDMDQVNAALRKAQAEQATTALKAMANHIQSIP